MEHMVTIEKIKELFMSSQMNSTFVVEQGEQTEVPPSTWKEFFENIIQREAWHYSDTKTTPHLESLYDHLMQTGKICFEEAQRLQYPEKEVIKSYICGLCHDIGKPGCRQESSVHYSFKGHGIVGGALLETYLSDDLVKNFEPYGLTKDDFGDISVCIDCHMCGYFANRGEFDNRFHKGCFSILPQSAKKILCTLRVGDQLARIPRIDKSSGPFSLNESDIKELVMGSQDNFIADIMSPSTTNDLLSLLKENKLTNGVLVKLQGSSSVGKTTLAEKLCRQLNDLNVKTKIISRDNYLVKWSRYHQKLEPIDTSDITPEIYQQAMNFYKDNDKFFRDSIDKEMKNDITDGLFAGDVVFVDTLMMAHAKSAKCVLSDACKRAFRIDIWVHRSSMITEDETHARHGIDLPTQVKLHGSRTIMNPFGTKVGWIALTPITEQTELQHFDVCKPHFAISCGWSGLKDNVLENLVLEVKRIYDFNQSIPRFMGLHHTSEMHLPELINFLHGQGGMDVVSEFFDYYCYRTMEPSRTQKILGIKYIDGINQIWNTTWAREARGRFYHIGVDEVITLKDGLQRGVEILTKAHVEDGVNETQDISENKLDRFDVRQQKTLRLFGNHNNEINGYLTGKVDGSLLEINIYPMTSKQYPIMVQFLEDKRESDPFVCVLLDYCKDNDLPLINISTQGTLVIGDQMRDYFLTSIEPYLEYKLNMNESDYENWQNMCPQFVQFMREQLKHFPNPYDQPMFIKYESVCKNRTTYRGSIHIELAVGYQFSGISLLGIMLNNKYIPHYEVMSSKDVVPHPVSCHVKSTTQVFEIMRELNKVVMSDLTMSDFMLKWFPDQTDYPIHAEGFVYLDTDEENDYSKIKLPIYYTTHKVKSNEVQKLLALPPSVETYFPVISRLRDFYNNLEPKLISVLDSLIKYIHEDIHAPELEDSVFYNLLNVKAQVHVNKYRMEYDQNNGNAHTAEEMKLKTLVYKIIINVCKSHLSEKIDMETTRLWQIQGENQRTFVHMASMIIQPWMYKEHIQVQAKVHEALKSSALVNAAYAAIVNIGEGSMVCL